MVEKKKMRIVKKSACKVVTCPECGTRICKTTYATGLIIACAKCKSELEVNVDERGAVTVVSVENNEEFIPNNI